MAVVAPRRPTSPEVRSHVPGPGEHRRDIDGLRAVAILLVVAFHAGVPGAHAGFVGVDVFFVLSGYLITGIIAREIDGTGGLRLGRFWVRRARRLLPAAATTIALTTVASQLIVSPLALMDLVHDAVAGLLYVSNHAFAGRATDYFADDLETSPFLHLWSLAVEEQFYVVWPILMLLVTRFAGTATVRARRIRVAAVALVGAGSFWIMLQLVEQESPWAFFGAISRGWEFAAGGITALVLSERGLHPLARHVLTAAGATALGATLVVIGPADPFPGWNALLPVAGTVMVLVGRPSDPVVGSLLRSGWANTLGRLSYSWYLWHWPVIVLGQQQLDVDTWPARTALAIASLAPAWGMHHLVENRIRHARSLQASQRRSVAVVAGICVAAAAVVGVAWIRTDRLYDDPVVAAALDAQAARTDVIVGCGQVEPEMILRHCSGGDPDRDLVLVVGDSHAAHWLPGVRAAAADLDMRWAASAIANCPLTVDGSEVASSRCRARQRDLDDMIVDLHPSVVVMSHSVGYFMNDATRPDKLTDWQQRLADLGAELAAADIDLLVVLDVPRFDGDPLECAIARRDANDCEIALADLDPVLDFHAAERAALAAGGHGTAIDPLEWLCAARVCPLVVDGRIAYADEHHLTAPTATDASTWIADGIRRSRAE